MSDEIRLPPGNALVVVEPCSATNRQKLQDILDNFGMTEIMPEPTTPKAALRAAMVENFPAPPAKEGIKHRCDPHKNGSEGYKIGAHRPADALDVGDRYTTAEAIATLRMRYEEQEEPEDGKKPKKPKEVWTGGIHLEPYDSDKERAILSYMKHVIDYVPAGKLRETVTAIIEKCGGRRLIEDQPMMWLTVDAVPYFKQIKTQIEAASAQTDHHGNEVPPTRIHVLTIMADEEMARAVIGMLMGVVEKETARVESRLAQPALSVDQACNDIQKAMAVKEELERYETLLRQPLTTLTDKAKKLVVQIAERTMDKAAMSL